MLSVEPRPKYELVILDMYDTSRGRNFGRGEGSECIQNMSKARMVSVESSTLRFDNGYNALISG